MQFDHFVIAVHDLAETAADYRALGFKVIDGGEHADGKSRNALIAFQDGAYLELIAFTESLAGTKHRWAEALERGEGLVTYALRVDDLTGAIARLQERGFAFSGPVDGGRLRPDGQRVAWRTGRAARMPERRSRSSSRMLPITRFACRTAMTRCIQTASRASPGCARPSPSSARQRRDIGVFSTRPPRRSRPAGDAPGKAIRFPLGGAWLS